MSIVFMAPVDKGGKKAIRGAIKKMGVSLANTMKAAGEVSGDHILVTEDIPAGTYDFSIGSDPNGMVQIDLTPGAAP